MTRSRPQLSLKETRREQKFTGCMKNFMKFGIFFATMVRILSHKTVRHTLKGAYVLQAIN